MDGPPPLAAAMLPASGVASGEFYWVSDDKSAWVACRCERTGARATLTRPDGSTLGLGADKLGELEPVDAGSVATVVDNLVELDSYSEGAIAYQLGRRYENSEIYTFVGSILVAVNPFQNLPRAFYSEDAMARCLSVERAAQAGGVKPAPHSAAGCCNACAMDDDCESSFYVRGAENQTAENFQGECFGLHITSVEGHGDGNASVAFVEAQFTEKLEGLKSFDAFLDYNAALYTQTLDWYVANLEALGLPWLPATWPYGVEKTGYSVFFHVPKTQLVVELVSLFPPSHNKVAIKLEQRMTDDRIAQMGALHKGDPRLLVSSVSRAATNLTAIHDFYRFGLGARQTMGLELADVRKKCFQINGTTADVCFVKRGDDATAGDFKVGDFEALLKATHDYYLDGTPDCAMDRWMDNHFAIDTDITHEAFLDWILDHPDVRYSCPDTHRPGATGGGVHYVIDPTGWGIQMDGDETKIMPGCEQKAAAKDEANACDSGDPGEGCLYWCDAGTC